MSQQENDRRPIVPAFHYSDDIQKKLYWCVKSLLAPGARIKRATLQDDFGGIDGTFIANSKLPIQFRCRFNRPAYAADSDITFRHTEPDMIHARTYAPISVYCWFVDNDLKAARCVDIYRMARQLNPTFKERVWYTNGDGTRFCTVEIGELFKYGALLKLFDGHNWATGNLSGQVRLDRIYQNFTCDDPICCDDDQLDLL
jgi:hypothetical protein